MQSKGAKIGFIVLLIVFGIGAFWFYKYGPMAKQNNATKEVYQNYVKAEATIVSQESNGRVGKGASTIWTIQFKDASGELQTVKMDQSSFMAKDNGSTITVYYDPTNPNAVTSEESYNEAMK